jgi:RNA polymerase sigma-70 factor (ECF subfamily)
MLDRAECQETLVALVAALPDRFRAAVVLRHVQDLPYVEVAAILGQPTGTVSRSTRSRRQPPLGTAPALCAGRLSAHRER